MDTDQHNAYSMHTNGGDENLVPPLLLSHTIPIKRFQQSNKAVSLFIFMNTICVTVRFVVVVVVVSSIPYAFSSEEEKNLCSL